MTDQKITPCLWFDMKAEEAVAHYLSIFESGRIVTTARYGGAGPGPVGAVMTILFEIEGQQFLALNGGPHFKFTPAISLIVDCSTQAEVDKLWDRLGEGGEPGQCGWLTDKFGVSWQIVPNLVPQIMQSGDAAAIERVMRAVMPMKKLDMAKLQLAFDAK
ncbi:MAG: VOC family protein [Roseiarcus sp.]|uniref:VOC family protein n=1 Tax=Roseiarcus sp. TaxID=1969460 RepID=UPI003BAECFB0